jgi:cytochrome d ubiquinol oxidase subunit II
LHATSRAADAVREGEPEVPEAFRVRALATGAVTGVVGLAGIGILNADAPLLFAGLTGRALPLVVFSVMAGIAVLIMLAVAR